MDGRTVIRESRRSVVWLLLSVVALWGCSRAVTAPPAPAPAVEGARQLVSVDTVPVPRSFREAIEAGTRTRDGRPGPRYWQQRVDYRIDAELDPKTGRLQGEEVITYHNRSPDTLRILVLHLYQNLFRPGEARVERVPVTEGMTIERIAVAGSEAVRVEDGGDVPPTGAVYQEDGTLLYLRLPRPLLPGDSTTLQIAWHFTVPPAEAPRTGHIDHVVYNVAQWYPQVAVYDDVHGWDATPYWSQGEFYLEYGDFDVSLTLPEGWVVAATGTLENPDEVLTPTARRRLQLALERDTIVQVITADDLASGNATQRVPGGQLTWQFRARNVRDFAFAASNRYLWDATRAVTPDADGDGRPEVIAVHALYRPEAEDWREAARYTQHAVQFHASRWYPYVYPQITSVEGPVFGMEYPMIVFVQSVSDPRLLYTVITHEVGHMWFPMMVGSNEHDFAWQDEGLNTYIENLSVKDFFPDTRLFEDDRRRYFMIAGTDLEKPMMREADLYGPGPAYVIAAYSKPSVVLRALAKVVGEDTLHAAIREYTRRWLFKHPMALDFFNTVESVVGRDLDWFWQPWWYTTNVLDQAIVGVEVAANGGGEQARVTVENQGEIPMPVELVLTMADGQTRRVVVPVEVWLGGARRHTETVDLPGRLERVEIDPQQDFPDVDRTDNVWTRQGGVGG